jgi:hypothetical protein
MERKCSNNVHFWIVQQRRKKTVRVLIRLRVGKKASRLNDITVQRNIVSCQWPFPWMGYKNKSLLSDKVHWLWNERLYYFWFTTNPFHCNAYRLHILLFLSFSIFYLAFKIFYFSATCWVDFLWQFVGIMFILESKAFFSRKPTRNPCRWFPI